MDIYFILWIKMIHLLFFPQIVPALAIRSSPGLTLVPLCRTHILPVLGHLLTCWHSKALWAHPECFLPQPQIQPFVQRANWLVLTRLFPSRGKQASRWEMAQPYHLAQTSHLQMTLILVGCFVGVSLIFVCCCGSNIYGLT